MINSDGYAKSKNFINGMSETDVVSDILVSMELIHIR